MVAMLTLKDRSSTVHPVAAMLITFVVYALTMPRGITLEDAGLFQMVCHLGGLSHPPGYPLFTLLCNGMVQAPGVANGNLVSALFGGLAVAMLHVVCFRLLNDRLLAYVASLAWGFSTTFWSQAIIIEVYTLAAFLFMVCWWLLLEYVRTGRTGYWFAFCFAWGLSLSNHWPLMILSSAGLAATAVPVLRTLLDLCRSPRFILVSLGSVVLGLLPYLWLFAHPDPEIGVFGGIESVGDFIRYVARSSYSDHNPLAGPDDKLMYTAWLMRESVMQCGLIGAPVILLGVYESFRRLTRPIAASLLLIWIGTTFVLVMLLDFEYTPLFRAVFRPYPIIAFSSVAIWFALGSGALISLLGQTTRHAGSIVAPVAVVLVFLANFPHVDRSGDLFVDDYARTVLESLPANAILFARGDNQTGPLGYLHYVEKQRPDVELRDWDNLVFRNRLGPPFLGDAQRQALLEQFINNADRPVFVMEDKLSPRIDYGVYYRFNPGGSNGFRFLPELGRLEDLLIRIYLDDLATDAHEQYFLYHRLIQISRQYAGYAAKRGGKPMPPGVPERLERLQATFPGKLATLEKLVPDARADQKRMLTELAHAAEEQIPDFATGDSLAVFNQLYGLIHLLEPQDSGQAAEYFERSLAARPAADNASLCSLMRLYEQDGNVEAKKNLAARYPFPACEP